ncbi:hypothetical protein K438DRAFT_682008 [Mycena galopus ATCC 62051]|nr:hypothetical protein K438DRAFT_682008 [Mycena galopus ATCC 62051]
MNPPHRTRMSECPSLTTRALARTHLRQTRTLLEDASIYSHQRVGCLLSQPPHQSRTPQNKISCSPQIKHLTRPLHPCLGVLLDLMRCIATDQRLSPIPAHFIHSLRVLYYCGGTLLPPPMHQRPPHDNLSHVLRRSPSEISSDSRNCRHGPTADGPYRPDTKSTPSCHGGMRATPLRTNDFALRCPPMVYRMRISSRYL